MSYKTLETRLEAVIKAFTKYYTIRKTDITEPFVAEAEFHSHDEQYFLVKSAKLAEANSNDYVFFATTNNLNTQNLLLYVDSAWQSAQARIHPTSHHRNSDVTVIIIADNVQTEAQKIIPKTKKYLAYKCTFYGWSHLRLIVEELSTQKIFCNRMGSSLKKVLAPSKMRINKK